MIGQISVTVLTNGPGTDGLQTFERLQNDLEEQRVTAIVPWRSRKRSDEESGVSMLTSKERFQRLGQGCSCCTVRSDIITRVRKISTDQGADHIVIQVPPKSDIDIVTKTFTVTDENGSALSEVARIESLITVVEGSTLLSSLGGESAQGLIRRIQISSGIWVDGFSELDAVKRARTIATLHEINPRARILRGDEQLIPLSSLCGEQEDAAPFGEESCVVPLTILNR